MSVAIRKVLLDDGGRVLKTCVEPRLHLLKKPPKWLKADSLVEKTGGMSIGYTSGDSVSKKYFTTPPYEHRTIVNPLYGLRRTRREQYRVDDIFDLSRQPVKYGQWSNMKVLQVNDAVLTTERILRLIVNKEGAHVEPNEMTGHSLSSPVELKLPHTNDELYRKGNLVKFSGISYLQIFTLLVGVYLVNTMKATLEHIPDEKKNRISNLARTIQAAPPKIKFPTLSLTKEFGIGAVLYSTGDPNNPFELEGDYEKGGITMIQIPGWK